MKDFSAPVSQRAVMNVSFKRMGTYGKSTGVIPSFSGTDRTGLAADPVCPNMAVCSCVNGKGLTLFDLRMPLPLDFVYDLHPNIVRDITFVHNSWPFVRSQQSAILSLSTDGVCKVTTLDGRYLHCFEVDHVANSIAPTPENYRTGADDEFHSGYFILLLM
ncbi:WD_REPEATS_REGION domain-containing protein [Trichonephila clavipes]|uniref:WD_REPEATS_REGION domain-containing protein n=1 Tax=Trichonephila clavipes TaxID=2585209 RepID=A0A8X7BHE3_TRICX|nr:WD_REPEATS_REGION domain-containing protein [Trichonephila clavipes]